MGKFLITGRQGSGKTTAIRELQKRGYTAYNTDDLPSVTKLQNKITGKFLDWPEGKVDWTKCAWNWQEKELKKLLASDATVFIGAVVTNQRQYYSLFDKVFVLVVDEDTVRQRLATHEHKGHHLPGEVERIVANHTIKQNMFIEEGAFPISGMRSTDGIVDDILHQINLI